MKHTKHTIEKRFSRTVLAASIAAIGFSVPLAAQAEDDDLLSLTRPSSEIEVGVGHVSDGSFKFGDYGRGLEKSGAHLIGNVRMNTRGDNNASYLELIGRNLGLSGSRDFGIKAGEQGNYGLSFEYDELSKLHSDSFQSPYNGLGSSYLSKPVPWTISGTVGANTNISTATMTDLAANMKRFDVETQRKAMALGLTKQLDGGWDVAMKYKREKKDGTQLTGAMIQTRNFNENRGSSLAPEPIDYTTDLFDVLARYADEKLQMQFGYHASLFDSASQPLVWDNLYYNALSTVQGGNALTGRHAPMPDNQFHRVKASGGYTLSKDTRLTANLSLGRATQNEAFLPYSTLNTMPATTSLNGRIDTTHADIKLNSELTHELNLTAGYKYDDRDNRTPVNTYTYYVADNTDLTAFNSATVPPTGGVLSPGVNVRNNTPLSKTQQQLYADIDYHLSAATKLMLGYDYDKITHTYEPTAGDTEHTLKAEVKHNFSDTASGGLAYAYSNRNASAYDGMAPAASTFSATYLASLCQNGNSFSYNGVVTACTGGTGNIAATTATAPYLDTPALRKFFLTDRKRDKLRAYANFAPSEKLDLQIGGSYYKEKYPEAEIGYGLTKATGWSANFDANWAATEAVNGIFFATFEDSQTDQRSSDTKTDRLGRQLNTQAFFDQWGGVITRADRSLTLGLGFKVKQDDSLDWGGNLTHAATVGSTGFSSLGTSVAATLKPMPDTVSRLSRLELFGKYKVQKDLTLNVKYAYEQYNSVDWAWDGQTIAVAPTNFINTNQTSPDYRVNVIGASLTYSFK